MKKMLIMVTLLGGAVALGVACQVATSSEKTSEKAPEAPVSPTNAANPVVVMETSMGTIKIELFQDKSPITVKNFLDYVDAHHFDGTIFHRVIADFMIQGGGFGTDLKEKETRGPIKNEASNGLANKRGTLAMARTNDPNSASAQFFINVKDNAFLDRANARDHVGYAVFGQVIEGMDVVDKIRAVRTGQRTLAMRDKSSGRTIEAPSGDVPLQNVEIKSVKRAP